MPQPLCHIDEIEDPGARGFSLKQGRREYRVFIVRKDNQVYAYENSCPHAGLNLEWQEHDFLDTDKNFIQCSVHGALFSLEQGECVGGPCNGEGLTALNIEMDSNGQIFLLDT